MIILFVDLRGEAQRPGPASRFGGGRETGGRKGWNRNVVRTARDVARETRCGNGELYITPATMPDAPSRVMPVVIGDATTGAIRGEATVELDGGSVIRGGEQVSSPRPGHLLRFPAVQAISGSRAESAPRGRGSLPRKAESQNPPEGQAPWTARDLASPGTASARARGRGFVIRGGAGVNGRPCDVGRFWRPEARQRTTTDLRWPTSRVELAGARRAAEARQPRQGRADECAPTRYQRPGGRRICD